MNDNNNKTNLWQLLKKHEIVVPIIQRDYAQGRKGKEELRYKFLTTLKEALEDDDKEAKLDFVYGGVDNNQMAPLDGQQRLTTLWLLHWFIAFRAGILNTDKGVCARLKKFYYATRPSSTEFCRRLVDEFSKIDDPKGITRIVEYIKNQHWYYSYYNNDPTIKAMLMMIEGDRSKDKKGHEKIINGLEQFFKIEDKYDYTNLWEKLTKDECPIQFYHKDMIGDDIPLVDDLYIKMNARGKQLTNFENFKAELIGYEEKDKDKEKIFKFLDIENDNGFNREFVSNLDNSWMNIFWPYKHKGLNRVDEIYFRFLNQFMHNYYLVTKENKIEKIEIDKTPLFSLLMDGRSFNKIEDYKDILDDKFKESIFATLNGIAKCSNSPSVNKELNEYLEELLRHYLTYNNKTIKFIPEYDTKGESEYEDQDNQPTTTLGQIPHIIFFAICKFFEKWDGTGNTWDEDTEIKLQDWVRFCYNISYNPVVNSVSTMQSALKLIKEISDKVKDNDKDWCLDIYGSLSSFGSYKDLQKEISSGTAKEQIEEEYFKATYQRKINNLRHRYIEAENYSFFKGCIRFLLWDEKGEYQNNAASFITKFENAKKKFCDIDTLEGKINNKNCFRDYFCACTKIEDIVSGDNDGNKCIRFNNTGEMWRFMLTNKSLCQATHNFLSNHKGLTREDLKLHLGITSTTSLDENHKRLEYVIETVCENDFMSNLESLGGIVDKVLFLRTNYEWALYPFWAKSDMKFILLGTCRNQILKQLLNHGKILTENQVKHSSMFYGWNIPFSYEGKQYAWTWDNKLIDIEGKITEQLNYDADYDTVINWLNQH